MAVGGPCLLWKLKVVCDRDGQLMQRQFALPGFKAGEHFAGHVRLIRKFLTGGDAKCLVIQRGCQGVSQYLRWCPERKRGAEDLLLEFSYLSFVCAVDVDERAPHGQPATEGAKNVPADPDWVSIAVERVGDDGHIPEKFLRREEGRRSVFLSCDGNREMFPFPSCRSQLVIN